jgi:hypothetical protein
VNGDVANLGNGFLSLQYIVGRVRLIFYRCPRSFAFFALLLSCAHFAFTLATKDSFTFFLKSVKAHVRSTARPRDVVADAGSEGHGSGDSAEWTESAQLSNVGSHSRAGVDTDEGSRTRSYYFGPSTVTVSHIREMIVNGYFAEGMGHEPREETVPEPYTDEVVVFEEFFTAGLRMPPHPVLSNILLKFQVQLHQLTPNAMVKLSKYIWVVASFGGIPSADGFAKRYELHYQPRKIDVNGAEVQGQYGCINFYAKRTEFLITYLGMPLCRTHHSNRSLTRWRVDCRPRKASSSTVAVG